MQQSYHSYTKNTTWLLPCLHPTPMEHRYAFFATSVCHERFPLVLQTPFVAAHDDEGSDDEVHAQHERYDADRPHQPVDIVAEQIAAHPVERCPDDAPKGIEEQKARPAQAIGPGQKRSLCAQHGDEAPQEDDFTPMLHEQILPQFQLALL